jgi:hypothetical protein
MLQEPFRRVCSTINRLLVIGHPAVSILGGLADRP